jgi:hypothetical protein
VPGSQTRYHDTSATDTSKTYYYKVLAVNAAGTSCGANEVAAPYLGDTCSGLIIHQNDPTHSEANLGTNTPASLLIDYVAVGEPSGTNNMMFKIKVNSLASIPPNSRWRIVWNSFSAEAFDSVAQQYYVGMTTGPSGAPAFEYGTLADAGVPAVFVILETRRGDALAGSNFNADGTITIFVPKSAVGNPQPGDLLGAVNGRTFTGDVPGSAESKLERSNVMIDHTFVKAQTDNSYPAATYTIAGNVDCSPFIEQNVNSLVALQASNPASASGISSFNLAIQNTSAQTIFTPLRVEVAQLTSASGRVRVSNADNGQTGAGANWDYSGKVGTDNILSAGEVSGTRNLKFSNSSNEAFTVTCNVIGNLSRDSSSSSTTSSAPSSSSAQSNSDASSGATIVAPASSVTNLIFQLTYNPLLNTVTVQLISP